MTQDALDNRWITCRNAAGEEIPGHSVAVVTGVEFRDGTAVLVLAQHSSSLLQGLVVTGYGPIADGEYGVCTFDPLVVVACDANDGPAALGQFWGPKSDQWTLAKNYAGFYVLGEIEPGLAYCRRFEGALLGKADSAVDAGQQGIISLQSGETLGAESDTADDIDTVHLRLGNAAANAWVYLLPVNGRFEVINTEC